MISNSVKSDFQHGARSGIISTPTHLAFQEDSHVYQTFPSTVRFIVRRLDVGNVVRECANYQQSPADARGDVDDEAGWRAGAES